MLVALAGATGARRESTARPALRTQKEARRSGREGETPERERRTGSLAKEKPAAALTRRAVLTPGCARGDLLRCSRPDPQCKACRAHHRLIGAVQDRRKTGEVHVAAFAVRGRAPARAVRQLRTQVRHRVIAAELLDEPCQSVPATPAATRARDVEMACPSGYLCQGDASSGFHDCLRRCIVRALELGGFRPAGTEPQRRGCRASVLPARLPEPGGGFGKSRTQECRLRAGNVRITARIGAEVLEVIEHPMARLVRLKRATVNDCLR
ncbi:hypothetical protein AWB65_06395 [Caballeronia humi]|uniref:Uncharacterized protein n=1 Tax=Caballeronia humi TaxID=326474 RepID=A0A158JEI3_9BURK|nr:hypothetical protein AWB65_06395 [Caballeronia humi]